MAKPTLRQAIERSIADMRRASNLCDESSTGDYPTRMIALAMIAREFLRQLPDGAALAQPDAGEGIEASVVRDLPGCPVSACCVLEGCRGFATPTDTPPPLSAEEWAEIDAALLAVVHRMRRVKWSDKRGADTLEAIAAKCRALAAAQEQG